MLRLSNVKKSFVEPSGNKLTILDVPQFEVGNGEQMVLVGPSGCGKTTLLHVIAGIRRPDSGTVEIGGLDIAKLPETSRKSLWQIRVYVTIANAIGLHVHFERICVLCVWNRVSHPIRPED